MFRPVLPMISLLALIACGNEAQKEGGKEPLPVMPIVVPDNSAAAEEAMEAEPEAAWLRAEIRDERSIWLIQGGDAKRPLTTNAYRLSDASGRRINISAISPSTASETLLVPAEAIDITRVHYVDIPSLGLRTRARFDGWFRELYSAKPLGANVSSLGYTDFRLFAPRANMVRLYLYQNHDDDPAAASDVIEMMRDTQGVWEARLPSDLHGTYYDFTIHGPQDPGNAFYETQPVHVSDPYARVNVEADGKSRVWRTTTPATPLVNGRPPMEDVVAYEVHVQDFTDRLPVDDSLKGTLSAMAMPGLTNAKGEPIGFDYLVDLGINVVHLMPVQEYLHYPDEEWKAAFGNDPFMREMGIAEENYQWGYRTTHALAIETKFRQKGTEHGAQRDQFRDLVQAFHDRGIAVIIDIVPNHTGENMDGRHYPLNFNGIDKQYYYRTDDNGDHIGPYGNEVKTEDRPMVQRWIIDQCKLLIQEFGIDGFRIDLAGQIDEQTLYALRAELGDDVIIYGEPWIDVTDPYIRDNPDWDWYKEDSPITFFQDDTRNALIGSPFVLENPATDLGYAGGLLSAREAAMRGIANDYAEEDESNNQGINYIDIHDNWTLADRFAKQDWDGRTGVDEDRYRIAAGLLLTSLGPVVLHGGSEIMRSKGIAPIEERTVQTASGHIELKGRDDTYNVRTPNQFDWETVGETPGNGAAADYAGMYDWWKGLIRFRLSEEGKVFRQADVASRDRIKWVLPDNKALLGYMMDKSVLILTNVGDEADIFESVTLPEGNWTLIAHHGMFNVDSGFEVPEAVIRGGQSVDLDAPPTSFRMWVKR